MVGGRWEGGVSEGCAELVDRRWWMGWERWRVLGGGINYWVLIHLSIIYLAVYTYENGRVDGGWEVGGG